jgi:hypothetical protein
MGEKTATSDGVPGNRVPVTEQLMVIMIFHDFPI